MNLLACIHKLSVERLILLLLAATVSIACATTKAPFAQVENVVKGNRLAAGAEVQGLQVTRGGASLTTAAGMALLKGDRIVTDGATEAVILFGDAYEVILAPDTEITILNPTIFQKIGRAVVKKLKEIREKFRVETEYVNAGVEHTEFAISVDRANVVSVVVLEGAVTIESKAQSWAPQTIGAGEGTKIRGEQPPSRRERLPKSELDRNFGWARRVEAIVLPAEVPDLNGRLLGDARQELSRAGLQPGSIEKVAAAGQRLDTVVWQGTPAGQHVRLGTRVDLRVTGESTVPDVRGMSSLEAGIALAFAGLQAGETSEEEDTGARPGRVARQYPPPGTRVPPGSAVSLVIAARQSPQPPPSGERGDQGERGGTPEHPCTVPDIRHVSVERAPGVLRERNLQLGTVRRVEGRTAGVTQHPEPGARVPCGSSVDLVIYFIPSGTSDAPPATRGRMSARTLCTVPDIRYAQTEADARSILQAAGLNLGEVKGTSQGPPTQSPEQGTRVGCGSSVDWVMVYVIR